MKAGRLLVFGVCLIAALACAGLGTAGISAFDRFQTFRETFYSIGWQDGWVVGEGPYDNIGGPLDSGSTSLRLGDENGWGAHQIRSILSFDTGSLPDRAIITSAKLILHQESSIIGGGNPFVDFRGLLIDIKLGTFGAPGLEPEDFQAIPDISSLGPYKPSLADTYVFPLRSAAYPYINKWPIDGGLTQLRLRFKLDSDHNDRPNYIHFSSGDEPEKSLQPQLVIEYHLPTRVEVGWEP